MQKGKGILYAFLLISILLCLFFISPIAAGAETLTPTPSGPSDSTMQWIFILVSGLVFLTAVLIGVIVYMLKLFKRKY